MGYDSQHNTFSVTVTVIKNGDSNYGIVCDPDTINMPRYRRSVTLVFTLKQVNTSGWQFAPGRNRIGGYRHPYRGPDRPSWKTRAGDDVFCGITIKQDTGMPAGQFNNPTTKPTEVSFVDLNSDRQTYEYIVRVMKETQVGNVKLVKTLTYDPSIKNQSDQ